MPRIPLLHDHHSHPLFYAAFQSGVCLEDIETKEEANDLFVSASQATASNIVLAYSWRSERYDWTSEELESLPPLVIFNVSLHSLLINDAGRQILHDKYGEVSAKVDDRDWYEANLRTVLNWFANLNASAEGLTEFFDSMSQHGLAFIEEMLLVDENEIRLFEQAELLDKTKFWAAPDTFQNLTSGARDLVTGLKLFTDGALGARTAAISSPFLEKDHKNENQTNFGMLIYDDQALIETIKHCLEQKPALAIHAIGDRAIEQVISAIETVDTSHRKGKLIRIEHAQMISQSQARRAKSLGLTLSMQPNFSIDSTNYSDRLSPEFCLANNPFRMLIDDVGFVSGEDLILGSDGMPHGFQFAIEQSLFPPFGSQRLSLDEFVAGYCLASGSTGQIEFDIDESNRRVENAIASF